MQEQERGGGDGAVRREMCLRVHILYKYFIQHGAYNVLNPHEYILKHKTYSTANETGSYTYNETNCCDSG